MHEDRVIALARQRIGERQHARTAQRWDGSWIWGLPLVAAAGVAALIVAPGGVPHTLLWLMGGVCELRPTHSYFAGALQLPLEARMIGIYAGCMATLLIFVAGGRLGARRVGSRVFCTLLALMSGSMVFDGVNSTLMEVRAPYLYTSTNLSRLVTGLLAGGALAPVLLWLINVVVVPLGNRNNTAVVRSWRDLIGLLAVLAGVGGLIVAQQSWLYYPLALLGVGGVGVVLTAVLLLVIVQLSGGSAWISRRRQLLAPASLAFVVSLALLAALAVLR